MPRVRKRKLKRRSASGQGLEGVRARAPLLGAGPWAGGGASGGACAGACWVVRARCGGRGSAARSWPVASWCLAGRGLREVSGGRGPELVAGTMEDDDSYGEWGPFAAPFVSFRLRRCPWDGARSAGWRQCEGPGVTAQALEGLRVAGAQGRLDLRIAVNVESPGPEGRRELSVTRP